MIPYETIEDAFLAVTDTFKDDFQIATIEFNDVEVETLVSAQFMLVGMSPDLYYLSFNINNFNIYEMSKYTHKLTMLLSEHLQVIPEFFYDKPNNTFLFGEQAYALYKTDFYKKSGMKLCPICEKPVHKVNWLEPKGWCKVCDELVVPNLTIH